jgi:hypothetical protein
MYGDGASGPVVLSDRSLGMLNRAVKRLRHRSGPRRQPLMMLQADGASLPLASHTFSSLLLLNPLHVVCDRPGIVAECGRLLIPGRGRLFATCLVRAGRRGGAALAFLHRTGKLVGLQTMREVVRSSLAAPRAVSGTLMAMGILAITLAAVGLYGVVSYVTAGRTPEFGVRLALGATSSSILRLVLGYGMRLALVGGTVGLALGLGALRVIEGMLFGSWTYAPLGLVVGGALGAVTLAACIIPAMRASGVSPSTALRTP